MPGAYEIARTNRGIKRSGFDGVVLPLHGDLSRGLRMLRSQPMTSARLSSPPCCRDLPDNRWRNLGDRRRLARSENTILTAAINTLSPKRYSRASADQRAGRAGRTAPGRCIRLGSERDHLAGARKTCARSSGSIWRRFFSPEASGVVDLESFHGLSPRSKIAATGDRVARRPWGAGTQQLER